ncbi:tryptophan-rich sensory protein [Agromyces sp. NPDC056523]|uniref:tryptophan-rich sensory protein n=1 Tax=Agromyces sp. NPDC056523 TaxID=3345850 RepID=UPI003672297C
MATGRERSTDGTVAPSARPAGAADTLRQLVVLLTSLLAIAAAFIGSGAFILPGTFMGFEAFTATPIQDAAGGWFDADATLLAPARPAFGIWSLIYAGMFAYALWQLLPAQHAAPRHRRVGYAVAASLVLNALWIGVVQFGLLGASLAVIAVLAALLGWIFLQLRRMPQRSVLDGIITDGSIGLYLGWVVVATAANATAVLAAAGFDGGPFDPIVWAVIVISVAGGIGVAIGLAGRGRLAPMLSICWGLAWISVARLTDEPASRIAGIAALIAAGVVAIVTIGARIGAMVAERADRQDRLREEAAAAPA